MRKLPPYDRRAPEANWPSEWPDYKKPDPTRPVHLTCGHSTEFDLPAPRPGDRIWCRSCRADRRVTAPTTNTKEN